MRSSGSQRPRIRALGRRSGSRDRADAGQGDLFRRGAVVRELDVGLSPFERALLLDGRGSEKAVEAYEEAIRVGDNVADSCCNLALLRYADGDRDAAVDLLTRALEYDDTNPDVHFNLGSIYQEAGWLRPAEVEYRLAVAFDADFVDAYYNLGLVCAQQKRIPQAVAALERFVELSTESEAARASGLIDLLRQYPGDEIARGGM